MIGVLQRVSKAKVTVEGDTVGSIGNGLLVLLGVENGDTCEDMEKLCNKMVNLRIFSDEDGKMNLSLTEDGGSILLVSQFTLMADCKKGRRPSFVKAGEPPFAKDMYKKTAEYIRDKLGIACEMGIFGAHMEVGLVNDGPVTIILNSKEL